MPLPRNLPTPQATPPDPGVEVVTFDNVLLVGDEVFPICEHQGRRFRVPLQLMAPGTTIRAPGDRGTLLLTRAVAEWLGMLR